MKGRSVALQKRLHSPTSPTEQRITAQRNKQAARGRLLGSINDYLRNLGLTPLRSRGVEEDGFLLLDVVTHYPCFNYVIVHFNAIGPNGPKTLEDGTIVPIPYFMKFQMHGAVRKGCILLVVLNDTHLVFVRQHRAPGLVAMGQPFLTEAARGNPMPVNITSMLEGKIARSGLILDKHAERTLKTLEENEPPTSHPLGLLGRELQPLVRHGAVTVQSLDRMSDDIGILEDSSMSVAANDFWRLRIQAPIDDALAIRGDRSVGIRAYSIEDVLLRAEELDIRDGFTLTAIQLFLRDKYKHDPAWLLKLALYRMGAGRRTDEVLNLLRQTGQ